MATGADHACDVQQDNDEGDEDDGCGGDQRSTTTARRRGIVAVEWLTWHGIPASFSD
jgi:hypothetical protein